MQIDLSQLDKITNECYYPLFNNRNRYLVIYGGAGSGKSVFVAQKLLVRVMGARKHRILVARKVAKTIRESCFSLLRDMISDWGMSKLFSVNKTDMTITCTNGNQIIFAGLDDVEKLKSIAGITGIWIEEASEVSQDDFEQLDLRLRGNTESYKQVILTFNPISAQHWIKKLFVDDGKPDSHIVKTTYLDNRFIDDEYRQVIEQMQYTNPRYYQIYGKGEWGVFEGQFFNMWDSRIHVCKPFEIPQDWLRFRAMDWGSYHPYSVVS